MRSRSAIWAKLFTRGSQRATSSHQQQLTAQLSLTLYGTRPVLGSWAPAECHVHCCYNQSSSFMMFFAAQKSHIAMDDLVLVKFGLSPGPEQTPTSPRVTSHMVCVWGGGVGEAQFKWLNPVFQPSIIPIAAD